MSVRITYKNKPILESVIKGKRSLRSVVEEKYKPNKFLMEVIGDEIIAGFQGGRGMFMENVTFTKAGKPIGKHGKQYPYGIRREKSPDGTPYEELSDITIKAKRKSGSNFTTSILQEKGGTDQTSLINSLYAYITYSGKGVKVDMDSTNNPISLRLETGGKMQSSDWKKKSGGPIDIYLPPRPHRDVQDMVVRQIKSLLNKWAKQDNGKKV